ncbi:clp protease regulatory subunit clpx2, partial [Quercus suber]
SVPDRGARKNPRGVLIQPHRQKEHSVALGIDNAWRTWCYARLLPHEIAENIVTCASYNYYDSQMDTKNILFICGGAFVDLEKTISER